MRHAAGRQRRLRDRGQEGREGRGGRCVVVLVFVGGRGRVGERDEGGGRVAEGVREEVFPVVDDIGGGVGGDDVGSRSFRGRDTTKSRH